MFEWPNYVSTSSYQSIYQLGTAVALAFVVAGPAVRTILARQISDLNSLRKTLKVLSGAGFSDAQPRIELCNLLRSSIARGELDVVRVNSHTNIWYVAGGLILYGFLVACSIYQNIPFVLALIGIVVATCVIFTDPVRIARSAPKISKLIALVDNIARHQSPDGLDSTRVGNAKVVMALLKMGDITIDQAIQRLDVIASGKAEKTKQVDAE